MAVDLGAEPSSTGSHSSRGSSRRAAGGGRRGAAAPRSASRDRRPADRRASRRVRRSRRRARRRATPPTADPLVAPAACAAASASSRRSASGPLDDSKDSASASTVSPETRMFPALRSRFRFDRRPVVTGRAGNVAPRPCASTTPSCARRARRRPRSGDGRPRPPTAPAAAARARPAVARVRVRLRRDRTGFRAGPRHDRADREELRLRRHAPLASLEGRRSSRSRPVSSVRQPGQVEREQLLRRDEHARHLRARERAFTASSRARTTTGVPCAWARAAGGQSETSSSTSAPSRSSESLERELGNPAAGRAEPALPHSSTDLPAPERSPRRPAPARAAGRACRRDREGAVVAGDAPLDVQQLERDGAASFGSIVK